MEVENKTNLTLEVKRLNKVLTRFYRQHSLVYSFFRGILTGLGSVIGATIVVALLAYFLRNVNLIPLIGDWLSELTSQVINQLSPGQ